MSGDLPAHVRQGSTVAGPAAGAERPFGGIAAGSPSNSDVGENGLIDAVATRQMPKMPLVCAFRLSLW